MTAQDIFELLNPLWLKHPGTRPADLEWETFENDDGCEWDWSLDGCPVKAEHAADLAAIAIVTWLGERDGGVHCAREGNDWLVEVGNDRLAIYIDPSLLSALVSAAMAMEAE